MDSLPQEILRDILLDTLPCVHSEYPTPQCPHYECISSPLRVSHVCRSWRMLALSCRELWSYLYITYTEFARRGKQELMVEIFDTWLARTNGGQINFTIHVPLPSNATIQDRDRAEYIFTTLVENQHRWKNVDFCCQAVKFSPRFPGFNLTNMPLLTSLDLKLDHALYPVVDLTPSSRLKQLRFHHDNPDLVVGGLLPHLQQVELSFLSHERIVSPQRNRSVLSSLELLRKAPSLRHVRITTDLTSLLPLDGERVLLTGVQELSLRGRFGSHLPASIADTVTLPSLERFTFYGTIGGEKLLNFFQRSAPPLTHLNLGCLCLSWEDAREESLIAILRLLPDLRHLTLSGTKLFYQFFHELTVPDDANGYTSAAEQIVCPRLSLLQLACFSSETDTYLEPLLAMAKSRASVLGTFRTVTFYLNPAATRERERTVAIADINIDDYAGDIDLEQSITFE